MENKNLIDVQGNITPLSKTELGELKGGFGELETDIGISPTATNTNCSKINKKAHCSNGNCVCTCPGSNIGKNPGIDDRDDGLID